MSCCQQTYMHSKKNILGILQENVKEHSIVSLWKDTNKEEIEIFIGLLLRMGLDTKPSMKCYWSQFILYKNEFPNRSGISRNRFEALLSMIHFSDNEKCPQGNRLTKKNVLLIF